MHLLTHLLIISQQWLYKFLKFIALTIVLIYQQQKHVRHPQNIVHTTAGILAQMPHALLATNTAPIMGVIYHKIKHALPLYIALIMGIIYLLILHALILRLFTAHITVITYLRPHIAPPQLTIAVSMDIIFQ